MQEIDIVENGSTQSTEVNPENNLDQQSGNQQCSNVESDDSSHQAAHFDKQQPMTMDERARVRQRLTDFKESFHLGVAPPTVAAAAAASAVAAPLQQQQHALNPEAMEFVPRSASSAKQPPVSRVHQALLSQPQGFVYQQQPLAQTVHYPAPQQHQQQQQQQQQQPAIAILSHPGTYQHPLSAGAVTSGYVSQYGLHSQSPVMTAKLPAANAGVFQQQQHQQMPAQVYLNPANLQALAPQQHVISQQYPYVQQQPHVYNQQVVYLTSGHPVILTQSPYPI